MTRRIFRSRFTFVLAAMAGVTLGVALFTFSYGEGLSYFSADPRACANCHIMNDQYASWQKASHHTSAKCVDCHLPHDLIPKYLAKADNGWRHSKAFTLMDFHEPIQMTEGNSRILQDNCLRCHDQFVHNIVSSGLHGEGVSCVHCHATVGHGPVR